MLDWLQGLQGHSQLASLASLAMSNEVASELVPDTGTELVVHSWTWDADHGWILVLHEHRGHMTIALRVRLVDAWIEHAYGDGDVCNSSDDADDEEIDDAD